MASTEDDEGRAQRRRLDRMRIERPCDESWGSMDGSDHARHCERCGQTVHDVSALTASEVLALMHGPERACVRLRRRANGSVRTAASPRRRRLRVLGAAAGVALSGAAAWTAATWPLATLLMPDRLSSPVQEEMLMGLLMEAPDVEPPVWSPSTEELVTDLDMERPTTEGVAALLDGENAEVRSRGEAPGDSRNTASEPSGAEEPE